jgi:hypothetical protein
MPLMGWCGRAPAPPAYDAGKRLPIKGALPCPINRTQQLPRWASISARTRSMLSASINAAQSCYGRSGHAARWPGAQQLQREAGYIDARPKADRSTKTSCIARPHHTSGSKAPFAARRVCGCLSPITGPVDHRLPRLGRARERTRFRGRGLRGCWVCAVEALTMLIERR